MGKYKPRASTEEKRREILLVASDVFGKKGTSNATLEEIADRVGMTRAGVLHHFKSKRALLLEVIKFRDVHDLENLEGKRMPRGADLFRHLIDTVKTNVERPGIVQTFVTLSSESVTDNNPGREDFANRYDALRGEITDALIDIAKERKATINIAEAERASSAIIGLLDGVQLQWLLEPDKVDLVKSSEYGVRKIVASVFSAAPNEEYF
ncbi:MAG: TetR/AcrR family transcriptional regulator [Bifidobacterium sp.]|jgi:AcrR family transcriptional regulator|nr:TetR/AcrR family transcriptional regulator [Bifidobacterium sp.]